MSGKGFNLTWNPTSVGSTVTITMSGTTGTNWSQVVNSSVRLNHIFLKASADDTTFDFRITSPLGNNILNRKNNVGELNEAFELIMRGIYTLTISNVKNGEGLAIDDTFAGEFAFKDEKDK